MTQEMRRTRNNSAKQKAEQNAAMYNSAMTPEYLRTLGPIEVLRLTHPSDRPDFAREMHKSGMISRSEAQEFASIR